MNEQWDKEKTAQCAIDRKMLSDIHLAVCGDKEIGVDGLVSDVRDLKSWRRKLDLRVAGIAGAVAFLGVKGGVILEKIFK
jgi:hypothetical protein